MTGEPVKHGIASVGNHRSIEQWHDRALQQTEAQDTLQSETLWCVTSAQQPVGHPTMMSACAYRQLTLPILSTLLHVTVQRER